MLILVGHASAKALGHTPMLSPAETVVDGPSSDIANLNGLAISRDGTGGLVYLKDVGGVPHVFVSRLLSGSFGAPTQVDDGLVGPSSQPVIAAGRTGTLLVAFVNAGTLYVLQAANALTPFTALSPLYSGASNPSLSLTNFGKAYLAFTAVDGGGSDVRAAYYFQGQWSLVNGILNASAGDTAGSGTGRPQVAAAGDGIAIVVWGENGHIYSRRVVKTTPSVVDEQADPSSRDGGQEVSAGDPVVASGGDSSYAAVAFQETLSYGSAQQSRVFINRLHGSRYDGISEADGTAPGSEGADDPAAAVADNGAGHVTSEHDQSHEVFAAPLMSTERPSSVSRIDSLLNVSAPDAVPATAGFLSDLIAWQQNPGTTGAAEIRVRYAPDGVDFNPEQVVSSPALGATDADSGLVAAGDVAGDAAIAWVQGTGAQTRIVSAQLYQAPGPLVALQTFRYATSADPILVWSPSADSWGVRYEVTLDGKLIAETRAQLVSTPLPLANGRHTWVVTAVNQAGLRTTDRAATVFVDTVAPRVSLKLSGAGRVGISMRLRVTDTDSPPPLPRAAASGLASAQVRWGDGSKGTARPTMFHVYERKGTFSITVIVKDRAGNRTTVVRKLKITPKPKPKPKTKGKGKGKKTTRGKTASLRMKRGTR